MQQAQTDNEASTAATQPVSRPDSTDSADQPQCCGTGCTVCVLDYPELFSASQSGNPLDSETLAMLEAIEQAQMQVGRVIAESSELS